MEFTPHKKTQGDMHGERGFTLVEVLVSLLIFSIATSGVITVAYKGGTSALTAKNRVTATYLADEGIELMRAVRDTAMDTAPAGSAPDYNWVNVFLPMFTGSSAYCTAAAPCDVNVLGVNNTGFEDGTHPFPTQADFMACPTTGCPLYYDTRSLGGIPTAISYGYYIDNNGSVGGSPITTPSGFTRAIVVTPTPEPSGGPAYDEEVQVTSTVTWHEGSVLQSLTQTEDMYDWY